MICRPLTQLWMGREFWASAVYAPILIYSTIFSCLTTFMGSIYLASNMTGRSLVTSIIAGVINVSLNVILIPTIGLYGPPVSTVVSYMVVLAVRMYDSRKVVPFELRLGKLAANSLIILGMTVVSVLQNVMPFMKKAALILLPGLFLLVLVLNVRPVWAAAMSILPAKVKNIIDRIGTAGVIAAGAAAAVFAVVCMKWHIVFTVSCLLAFGGAAAFSALTDKSLVKLGGETGLFLTVWAAWGIECAFLALLIILDRADP